MCFNKASSALSTSDLVASSASLASMDPGQQEDYVASLRYFLPSFPFPTSTILLIPIILPWGGPAHPQPPPAQEHGEEAAGEGVQL